MLAIAGHVEDAHKVEPVEVVQLFQPQSAVPAAEEPDLTARRYDMARSFRSMRASRLMLDTTVVLKGHAQLWQAHGLVLASASPVFRRFLEDVEPKGVTHSCGSTG